MIFLINQQNQIRIFFFKNHTIQIFSMTVVGRLPPLPLQSSSCPVHIEHFYALPNCHENPKTQTDRWYFRKMANPFFMCVFKFIHSCVWKGCVISCVFISYVSSNPLPKKKHSHIGRICLTFLHCVFSKILHRRMQSHIGCIYLTFLHCAFSNVSSNRLSERMHSRIGCIHSTFLHCAFSNVSSNCLHKRMHNHTGCICLTFLRCAF